MKKILFLSNMYPSEENPSYGIFVKKTYEWLAETHDVTLVKISKKYNILQKIQSYIDFYMKAILLGIFRQYDCIYAHFISHCSFPVNVIKMFKKDIIIIGNIHGEDVFSSYKKYKKNRRRAETFLENSNFIVAPSEYFKNRLSKEYNYEKNKIYVSPSGGINTEIFKENSCMKCREEIGLETDKKYIGYVSRIEEGKGWDIFLTAFKNIMHIDENLRAIIVGEGSQFGELENKAKELRIFDKIVFFPLLSHEKLASVYASMDIFCFASRIKAESLGLVGLEAMACGIPSIITNCEGPLSYAENEYNCLTFNPEDANELSRKMEQMLKMDWHQIENIKVNARNTVNEYDSVHVKEEFMKFFNNILKCD